MGNDDENRRAILARRARYIAMALAGVSTATSATACVCLSPISDVGQPSDANAGAPIPDAVPNAGADASDDPDTR